MGKKILTAGEPMGLFIAQEEGQLEDVRHYTTSVAGAEFNVSVGLTRLGHTAGYISKVGSDPFGRQIIKLMKAEGIDTSMIRISEDHRTGFMLKGKTSAGDPDIYYYRKGSAASTLSPEDISGIDVRNWDAIHASGITCAISDTAREMTVTLMKKGREAGIPVFFDPNLRPQLWESKAIMKDTLNQIAALADYVLPGENEGLTLCGTKNPQAIGDFYLRLGVKAVIVKVGAHGAWSIDKEERTLVPSYKHGPIVDTVGAGDGFAAGLISGVLEGLPLKEAVQRGNAIGSIQIMQESDNEGLPSQEELLHYMKVTELDA